MDDSNCAARILSTFDGSDLQPPLPFLDNRTILGRYGAINNSSNIFFLASTQSVQNGPYQLWILCLDAGRLVEQWHLPLGGATRRPSEPLFAIHSLLLLRTLLALFALLRTVIFLLETGVLFLLPARSCSVSRF